MDLTATIVGPAIALGVPALLASPAHPLLSQHHWRMSGMLGFTRGELWSRSALLPRRGAIHSILKRTPRWHI